MDFDFPTVFNRILKTKKPSKCTLRIGNSSKVQNFFNTIFKGASEVSRILWARFAPEGMVCAFYFCMHAHAHALKSNPCDNIRREQARRKRLERVAQKIKKPGSATKQRERAADGNTVCATSPKPIDDASTSCEAQNDGASTSPAKLRKTQTPQKADAPEGDAPGIEQLLQTQSSLQALCDQRCAHSQRSRHLFKKKHVFCLCIQTYVTYLSIQIWAMHIVTTTDNV